MREPVYSRRGKGRRFFLGSKCHGDRNQDGFAAAARQKHSFARKAAAEIAASRTQQAMDMTGRSGNATSTLTPTAHSTSDFKHKRPSTTDKERNVRPPTHPCTVTAFVGREPTKYAYNGNPLPAGIKVSLIFSPQGVSTAATQDVKKNSSPTGGGVLSIMHAVVVRP
ncbi:unnamed protein product [Ectocarpus fasciculatus]